MLPAAVSLSGWKDVQAALDSFPAPALTFGPEGDLERTTWVFRGLKSAEYGLEPRIERDSKGRRCSWPALESMQLLEFQSKAPMYMNAYELPHPEDKLSWLALMQHQGVSTRLLDFSYSPYVALYFALRERTEKEQSRDGALWAIDADAVAKVAEQTFIDAEREEAEDAKRLTGQAPKRQTHSPLDQRFSASDRDVYEGEYTRWSRRNRVAAAPHDIVRSHFDEAGFVDLTLPPVQNRRLSSQQGVFLFNGAEHHTFTDSLFTMMRAHLGQWCKLFHIPTGTLEEAERRLFQMNIHDLALFPDMEGLATFVRQKARLHFAP